MPRYCKKAKKDRPNKGPSHPNDHPISSLSHPSEDHPKECPRQLDKGRRLLTVLYCEGELLKTLDIDESTTVAEAKELGSRKLLEYLRRQPNAPSDLEIDESCTDFYPGMIQSWWKIVYLTFLYSSFR
jgi:hypothetical protein